MTRDARRRGALGLAIAVAAALVAMLLPASIGTANAKPPPKPGTVSGLAVSATKPAAVYRVAATWNPATNATAYRVTLSNAAGTLDEATVSDNAFTGTASAALVNTSVRVQVIPLNGTRRNKATAKSILLPDLTAPQATYSLAPQSSADGNVTITQDSLSDDLSTAASITQSVDWGDGTAASTGDGSQATFMHSYPTDKMVYHPVVTVTDGAGNAREVTLTAVVGDYNAPTGTFSAAPVNAWARWTRVAITQGSLDDDLSDTANITRLVNWGDGVSRVWLSGTTLRHRYAVAGTYTPTVTITDEAGNSTTLDTASVAVTVDSIAPRLRLTLPKLRKASVRSWTTLKGRAQDFQTGVRKVRVQAIEKRGQTWYAYKPLRKVWIRAGATQAKAWSKATIAQVPTTATHTWSFKLQKLTRGTLIYRVSAIDNVNNATKRLTHRQVLTRR